jgi:hypothetical protein
MNEPTQAELWEDYQHDVEKDRRTIQELEAEQLAALVREQMRELQCLTN